MAEKARPESGVTCLPTATIRPRWTCPPPTHRISPTMPDWGDTVSMAEKRVQRRLAAILAADVVGYSRLTEADEEGTRVRLRSLHADLIDPRIAADGGRIVKTMGDGILVEFGSAVDAVRNALDIQGAIRRRNTDVAEEKRIEFRVGINVGDVIVEGDDIHGDGVNVAARLEGLCGPGEVYVSGTVYDQSAGKLAAVFEDLGEQTVKNLAKPVRVYRTWAQSEQTAVDTVRPLPLPDKPSIAVLPFDNMSGDPDQDYFADGITEDIITALSHIRWFFVIARNSTFAYKHQTQDVRDIARQLGVRYVVEGSVRASAQRLRLTVQLIDGTTGNHIWATRYDRELADIFQVQDELTQTLVAAIEPELTRAEQDRAKLKRPENLDNWDIYHRGMAALHRLTRESHLVAEEMLTQVTVLDPTFAAAFVGLAEMYYFNVVFGFADDPDQSRQASLAMARRAIELDREDSNAHHALARAFTLNRLFDDAVSEFHEALNINPSNAAAHYGLGAAHVFNEQSEQAISHLERAIRISPHDAHMGSFLTRLGTAKLMEKNYAEAAEYARSALRLPSFQWSRHMILISALGHLGRIDLAKQPIEELQQHIPDFSADYIINYSPHVEGETHTHIVEGMRKAGMRI